MKKKVSQEEKRNFFGRNLKEAFHAANIKAVDVARELGVTQRAVSGWVRGENEPKLDVLVFLRNRWGINPNFLLFGEGPPILPREEAALLKQDKKKHIDIDEELLRERHRYLVAVLENVFQAWKIIPKAAVDTQELSAIQKAVKPIKAAYSLLLELPGQALFFFANPYWHYCTLAIWRFYWALTLEKQPKSEDIATVAALYFKENDFLTAAQKLTKKLRKDWTIDEKAIQEEKFPFKPQQAVEPETLKFLRFAVMDLIDLHERKLLPLLCLPHHKVYWSECPVCKLNQG